MLDITRLYASPDFTAGQDAPAVDCDKDLGELTLAAMAQVGFQDRMVLALRFFEDMSYAEIARILGCSEIRVRLKFVTAKRTLLRELKRLGAHRMVFVLALAACRLIVLTSNAAA